MQERLRLRNKGYIKISWHKEFLQVTKDAEAPESYFYWAGLTAISAAVANRVYVNKKLFKVYPNLFVFLISKSSGLGKGVPVKACKNVLEATGNCRLIVGQNSIEGIIDELGNAYTTKSGRIITTAEATLLAGEFGSFLLDNPKLFTNLTDLYDSSYNEGDWEKRLVSRAKNTLKDICISGLFAANEVHFKEALPIHAIKGGFLGRTICIYESKRSKLDPLIPVEGEEIDIPIDEYKELACYLRRLADLKGTFVFTAEAGKIYRDWYYQFYNLDKEFKDDTGTAERLRDTVIKVAMLLSLADGLTLKIEKQHIEEAMIKCYQVYTNTVKMVIGEGQSDSAVVMKAVLKYVLSKNGERISRQELLIRGSQTGDYDYIELDRVIEHLSQSRIIKTEPGHGGPWYIPQTENINRLLQLNKEG